MSRRWIPVALAAMAVSLSGGCRQRASPRATPTSSSASIVAPFSPVAPVAPRAGEEPTTTAPSVVAPSTTGAAASDGARAGCPTSALTVSLGDLSAAAGTAYQVLVFTNVSTRTCTLQGYPGVSFVDGQGGPIGAPVARQSGAGAGVVVTLAPGRMAAAPLAYHDAYVATFPDCQPTSAAGIRVFPPGQTSSMTVPSKLGVCANPQATGTATISPVVGR